MIQTHIISAFPGTGKTFFHKNHSNISLDSDSSEFSWITDKDGNKIRNPEFPKNYIEHIKENIGKYKFIFVSSHKEVRDLLNLHCLFYYVCYPMIECKDEYIERYKNRGSDNKFIELISNNWENWIEELSDYNYEMSLELPPKTTLSDYLKYFY